MAQDQLIPDQLVVIGGSAGSLEVVLQIVSGLPSTLTAAIVVVLHRLQSAESVLVNVLESRAALPVREVEDKEPLQRGTIYIAPPNYHLLLENKKEFSLDASEKVHHSRPSIDVTFESAAREFGRAAVGILLSGANADGAAGLKKIKNSGGITLVQDPATAEVDYMPRQAIAQDAAIRVVSPARMAEALLEYLEFNTSVK